MPALIFLDILVLIDTMPLLELGAALLGTGLNAWLQNNANEQNIAAQKAINQANIDTSWAMARQNRQWSLEDYDRMNKYNSPQQQMQRLREAGLNPNLVYGSGGASTTAAAIRGSEPHPPSLQAARVAPISTDLPQIAQGFMSMKKLGAETDNLKLQNDLLRKEGLLKNIRIANEATAGEQSKFNLQMARELKDTSMLRARQETELQAMNLKLQPQQFELQKKSALADMLLKYAQTEHQRKVIHLAEQEGVLKQYEMQLNELGLSKHDWLPARWFMQVLKQIENSQE